MTTAIPVTVTTSTRPLVQVADAVVAAANAGGTEVIDIAAHIQETAPVGGIAMSERVADSLEGEPLARMRDMIDGWPIVLALNPTGD